LLIARFTVITSTFCSTEGAEYTIVADMPLCQGRPNGPCPDKRNDSSCSVKGTQGDLMLCPACDVFRFPPVYHAASKSCSVKNDLSPVTANVINETTAQLENKSCKDASKPELEINEVLCFVRNKYGNHPLPVIKETLPDFFREDEILHAKDALIHATNDMSVNIQSFCKKRIRENKVKASIDDIISICLAVDEGGSIDQLPTYCTVNTSRISVLPTSDMCQQIAKLQSQVAFAT